MLSFLNLWVVILIVEKSVLVTITLTNRCNDTFPPVVFTQYQRYSVVKHMDRDKKPDIFICIVYHRIFEIERLKRDAKSSEYLEVMISQERDVCTNWPHLITLSLLRFYSHSISKSTYYMYKH